MADCHLENGQLVVVPSRAAAEARVDCCLQFGKTATEPKQQEQEQPVRKAQRQACKRNRRH
jgi:hypothetical protein